MHISAALVIMAIIMSQAPVSDREYRATLPETAGMIDLASTMISEGRGSELMPRDADPFSPITAYRLVHNHIVAIQINKINQNWVLEIQG